MMTKEMPYWLNILQNDLSRLAQFTKSVFNKRLCFDSAKLYFFGFASSSRLLGSSTTSFLQTYLDRRLELIQNQLPSSSTSATDLRLYFESLTSVGILPNEIHNFNTALKNINQIDPQDHTIAYVMLNIVTYNDSHLGSGGGWHRDSNKSQYKIMVYLTEVTNHSGPFRILTLSHNPLLKIFYNYLYSSNPTSTRLDLVHPLKLPIFSKYLIHTLTGPPGTSIVFDGSTVHQGMGVTDPSAYRFALTAYIYPRHEINARLAALEQEANLESSLPSH